ncbi:MAG: glutamine-hydrolyzing GMP synthase [Anaerolineales bacterium]
MSHDIIIVLDFGSQYTQLITRVIRDQSVYSIQLAWNCDPDQVMDYNPKGIILSGGPASIYSPDSPTIPDYLLTLKIPILGICYGMQALTARLNGNVTASSSREYGLSLLTVTSKNQLIPEGQHKVWMSHGDRIETLPDGFRTLAITDNTPIAAMCDPIRQYYGVQFHPEVKHTAIGPEIIKNFLFQICKITPSWTPESIIKLSIDKIKETIGSGRVIAAVSGGVDSTVAATLVHKAVGDQLDAVFVDTGLLRKNEKDQVVELINKSLQIKLHTVEASKVFFDDLRGVKDPEQKRAIIGNRFIRLFEEQARALGNPDYLVQGTIYPDVVESAAPDREESETIKTHHNVGGLPQDMKFSLIEPLRYLFKDEVRVIGEAIGIHKSLLWRQPFPGPGLAIRCIGEVTPDRIKVLQEADEIFREELFLANQQLSQEDYLKSVTSQAFAVLLPVKTVGVMGDQRTYQNVIALRSVTTDDFMTADWSRLPMELLAKVSNRIVNEVPGINRVVYDITSKPPGTIEWE